MWTTGVLLVLTHCRMALWIGEMLINDLNLVVVASFRQSQKFPHQDSSTCCAASRIRVQHAKGAETERCKSLAEVDVRLAEVWSMWPFSGLLWDVHHFRRGWPPRNCPSNLEIFGLGFWLLKKSVQSSSIYDFLRIFGFQTISRHTSSFFYTQYFDPPINS